MPTPPPDKSLTVLAGLYEQIDFMLHDRLIEAARGGYDALRCEDLIAQLNAEVSLLKRTMQTTQTTTARQAYLTGARNAAERIQRLGVMPAALNTLPVVPLASLAADIAGQTVPVVNFILRETNDWLRKLGSGAIAKSLGIGDSAYATGKAIREGALLQIRNGVPIQELAQDINNTVGVKYRDGSIHSLQAYGQMAARTGIIRSNAAGHTAEMQTSGIHVVMIPLNGSICYVCAPYEGTYWALDAEGEAMGYPPFSDFTDGISHPNCTHLSVSPVVFPDPESDNIPGEDLLGMSKSELMAQYKEAQPELFAASKHGFANASQYERYKRDVGEAKGISESDLRGPRYRYSGIESRRLAATADCLQTPGLSYSESMQKQTEAFMQTRDYGQQRPSITPAAQQRIADAANR